MTLKKIIRAAAGSCLTLYLVVCVACTTEQRKFIYYPPVFTPGQADEIGGAGNLQRWLDASGKTIEWKRLSPIKPSEGQVLITHGNAGCACQCGHYADVIQQAAAFDVFIVEYPGYADRPGVPTEKSLESAAAEAFQSLDTNKPVFLVGESLGTGIACYLAGRFPNRISGIALLAPYDRLTGVAQVHMPFLPVWLLLCDRFPAEDFLHSYHGPLAAAVGGQDRVIPEKFGRRLYQSYTGPKKLWEFPEGNHGTLMIQPVEFWREIFDFWHANQPPVQK